MNVLTQRYKAKVVMVEGNRELQIGELIPNTATTEPAPQKELIANASFVGNENNKAKTINLKIQKLDEEFEIIQKTLIE